MSWIVGRGTGMRYALGLLCLFVLPCAYPQDLTPRAYVISPNGSYAVTFLTSLSRGDVTIDPTVPIEDANGSFQVSALGYYQSFSFLGRSANITLVAPYVHADLTATINGATVSASRSGVGDMRVRFATNLYGGRAMDVGEYVKWHEKRLIGASFTVTMPSGQYDPARLINIGTNRWGFKPEIGFTRRWNHWVADWYVGVWFFTGNHGFYPGQSLKVQKPVGAAEGHLGYYVMPRLWVSFDANFWAGDRTRIDGVAKQDEQRNSRIGGTASVPVTRHHSFKVSYSQGAYVRVGGAFKTLSLGWQYSWITEPR